METLALDGVTSAFWGDLRALLGGTRIFNRLTKEQLYKIALLCRQHELADGHVIYRPGQFAEDLYVLVAGAVGLSYGTRACQIRLSAQYGRHEIFGWASLLTKKSHRIATATLLAPSVVLAISGARLVAIMEQDFDIGFAIMREFNSLISSEINAFAAG
jgi:CRP-like cAMP-binding protein